jgi:hypothetical protein
VRSVRFTAASPCIGSKPQTLKRSDMHAHKRGCQAVQPRPKHDAASRTASYFGESPDPTVRPGRGRALTRLPRSLRRCSALATRNRFGDEVIAPVAGAGRLLRHHCDHPLAPRFAPSGVQSRHAWALAVNCRSSARAAFHTGSTTAHLNVDRGRSRRCRERRSKGRISGRRPTRAGHSAQTPPRRPRAADGRRRASQPGAVLI